MAAYTFNKEQMLEQKNAMKKQVGEGDLMLGPLHVGRLLGIEKATKTTKAAKQLKRLSN